MDNSAEPWTLSNLLVVIIIALNTYLLYPAFLAE
jgi:hypothetical protein